MIKLDNSEVFIYSANSFCDSGITSILYKQKISKKLKKYC